MVTSVPDVPKTDIVKYGEYLAGPRRPLHGLPHDARRRACSDMTQLGRGGNVFNKPFIYDWAAVVGEHHAAPGRGPRPWTDEEIKTAITTGVSRNGRKLLAVHAVRAVREGAGERPRRDRRVSALDSAARGGRAAAARNRLRPV